MPKKKVLHIIKSLGRGGAEVLLPETLQIHDRERFEFHYIYFLPWKDQMVSALKEAGGRVVNFPASGNLEMLRQCNRITAYCLENKIDLIHCHLPWSGFVGRLVHRKTGIPVIYTEHNIQERYHFITKSINKFTFNSQTLAIGVSEDVTSSINKIIRPHIPIRTITNGVNTKYFSRDSEKGAEIKARYNIPREAVVIGNVAVFRKQKCIPGWISALDKILKSQSNVYGLLVGAGPEEEEIKELVKSRNLEGKIILTGLQTDTVPFFSAMDIFMMSSAFEGLPVALLEAMSTECAVVSTKAGGVVEAIRNEKDGLLSEVGDWDALAKTASTLVKDPERRKEFQSAARKRVVESFSLTKMVTDLEQLYAEVS